MVPQRRVYARPYLFEVFTFANLAIIFLVTIRTNVSVIASIPGTFKSFIPTLVAYAAGGVVVRCIVAKFRGELHPYLRILRTRGWLVDTARLIFFGALLMHTYFWIKLVVPIVHRRLFDQELWDLDQAMFLGFSPNILLVDVFSQPLVMKVIDVSYARIFFVSMTVAFMFFLSAPSRRLRVAFITGNSVMWLVGAWLYMLIPSVGPAFRFPDVWMPYAAGLDMTQHFQALLMRNYQQVLQLPNGTARNVQLMFGVAAFPSLHVAFQTYVFLWMRRLWTYGEIVFGVFALIILIGSVVTGWHYLIDGLAGILLAAGCYLIGARIWRMRDWRRVRVSRKAAATPAV